MTAGAIVIEGSAAGAAVERVAADLAARGLPISSDWRAAAPGAVCTGVVDDERSAEQAVLAALAGAQVVVAATAAREVIDRLCDDLRRLGPLDHRVDSSGQPVLSAEERALLGRLLAGDSLGAAAAAVHMSRRTADRRLASARRALGVTTTAELLAAAARLRD